jgi:hypothetical protein
MIHVVAGDRRAPGPGHAEARIRIEVLAQALGVETERFAKVLEAEPTTRSPQSSVAMARFPSGVRAEHT